MNETLQGLLSSTRELKPPLEYLFSIYSQFRKFGCFVEVFAGNWQQIRWGPRCKIANSSWK